MNLRVDDAPVQNAEAGILPSTGSGALAQIISSDFVNTTQPSETATILLVEDELFVRRAIAEVLESAGYVLLCAGSAAEALATCCTCSDPVDLLLADVVLRGMNGHDLAAEFKCRFPSAQVLLMSAYPQPLRLYESSALAWRSLAKPFSVCTLLQQVRETLHTNFLFNSHLPCSTA